MELCETRADGKTTVNQCQLQVFFVVGGKKTVEMAVHATEAFLPEYGCCEFTILSCDVAIEEREVVIVFMFDCELDVKVLFVQVITKLFTRSFIFE